MIFVDTHEERSSRLPNILSKNIIVLRQPIAIANTVTCAQIQPMNVVVLKGMIFLTMMTFGFTFGYF